MDADSRPVGGGAGAAPFDGAASQNDDFRSCSLSELVAHASWKARKEGFERIQSDPAAHKRLLLSSLKAVAAEGNAAVQEAAIDALVAVLPLCDDSERVQLAEGVLPFVVEKGITGRPKAAQSSQSFVSALVSEGSVKPVFAALLPAFAHRSPKNRLAAAQVAASLVSDYGVQHFPTKEILKAMQPLFNDANAQVRKEAATLCCQCYQYIGAGIKGFLTDLRDVQLQELQKQFELVSVGKAPPKGIKGLSHCGDGTNGARGSTSAVKPVASLTVDENGGAVDDAAFELLDEAAVVTRLPKKFFHVALDKETTWQTRVDYVKQHLSPLLEAPRFRAKDDYRELAAMMKEYLVDPQAPLMLLGFKMIQECARGLRADFGPYARVYVAPLLDKLKDKKTSVQLHIMQTLQDLVCYNCLTMDQCNDEFDQALQSKNPTQRTTILNFLIRMVDKLGDKSRYVRLGRSTAMLTRLVNDEKASIRDVAYVLLDRLIQSFGDAPYKSVLATLDDNQRANMAAAIARGAPSVGPRSAGSHPASTGAPLHPPALAGQTPSDSPAKKVPRLDDVAARTSSCGPASRTRTASAGGASHAARRLSTSPLDDGAERGSVASSAPRASAVAGRLSLSSRAGLPRSAANANGDAATPGRAAVEDGIALESSLPPRMDAVTMILGFLNGDSAVLDMVRSTEWSRRQDGMAKLLSMVQAWTPAQTARGMNHLVVYVRAHPSFREPIFQVFSLMVQVFQEAVGKVPALSAGAGYALVSGFSTRLCDAKNKPLVRDICRLIAQKLGQRFVVRHMLDTATMARTPKLLQEVCEYVREAVTQQPDDEESEGEAVDVRGALHFIRGVCAEVNNTGVRQETVLLLVALHNTARAAAAVERCVAALPAPLPAMYEREMKRPESSRSHLMASAAPLAPPRALTTASAPVAAPAVAPSKRVRTSSQSPGPGARGAVSLPSPQKPPAAHRRTSSGDVDGPLRRPSGVGTASAPQSRVSTARTSSAGPSPRGSFAPAAVPPAVLRPILQELTAGEDWRDRLAGLRHAEEYVERTPRPLPANCAAPLLHALQTRFEEANKNIVVDVLRFIPVVVAAAGSEECSAALRKLAPGVLAMLGDQKAALREEACSVALLAMRVVGLESMLPLLQKPLGSDSNVCRQNVLEMMVSGFEQMAADATLPRAGMQLLTPAVINSMMDRILEVRVIAEQVLGWMIGVVGEDFVLQCVQRLKPAEQQVVMPAIERQLAHQRQAAAERERAEGSGLEPSVPSVQLNGTTNSFYDNEESRRTTPRAATPRAAHGRSETPVRRGSASAPLQEGGGATPRTAPKPKEEKAPQQSPAAVTHDAPPTMGSTAGSTTTTATAGPASSQRKEVATPPASAAAAPATAAAVPPPLEAAAKASLADRAANGGAVNRAKTPTRRASSVTAGRVPAEASALVPATAAPPRNAEKKEGFTIREIIVGLRSATPDMAQAMCVDFLRHLQASVDAGSPEMIQAMAERLYENTQNFNAALAKALVEALSAIFATPQCTARCHKQLLVRITGVFFDCLLSEKFSLDETVIKALNAMTLTMLENCRPDDVFGALLDRLTTYSTAYLASGHKSDLKYIQVTVKCVMRVNLAAVSADTTVLDCHAYLLQHPPSAFRQLDDTPIRTVKTLLQSATKRHGAALLATAERLVGPENLVTHFIRACLDMQAKAAKDKGQNEQQVIEESRQEQRASQSPAPPAKESAASSATPVRRTTKATPRKKRASGHADPHVTIKAGPPASLAAARGASKGPTTGRSSGGSPAPPPATVVASRRTPVKSHPLHSTATSTPNHSGRGSGKAHSSSVPSTQHETPRTASTPLPTTPPLVATTPTKVSSTPVDATKELTDIFGKIRNHAESASGVEDLYKFLKAHAPSRYEDAFKLQFNRCSEAFRRYLKRKLELKVEEDSARPASFQLPAVIRDLS